MSDWLHLEIGSLQINDYVGEFALLRAAPGSEFDLPRLGKAILDQRLPFIEEVIATEVEICLKWNQHYYPGALSALSEIDFTANNQREDDVSRVLEAPVWFSSRDEDWTAIAEQTGLDRGNYIKALLACRFQVAMIGFLPGFLYLTGLPQELQVARKAIPSKKTTRNAFALGGKYAGIYSLPSPAGWHVIGQLAVQLLDVDRLPPLLVEPGDTIVLQAIDEARYQHLMQHPVSILEYNGISNRS